MGSCTRGRLKEGWVTKWPVQCNLAITCKWAEFGQGSPPNRCSVLTNFLCTVYRIRCSWTQALLYRPLALGTRLSSWNPRAGRNVCSYLAILVPAHLRQFQRVLLGEPWMRQCGPGTAILTLRGTVEMRRRSVVHCALCLMRGWWREKRCLSPRSSGKINAVWNIILNHE